MAVFDRSLDEQDAIQAKAFGSVARGNQAAISASPCVTCAAA